jgi:hypothetical protein
MTRAVHLIETGTCTGCTLAHTLPFSDVFPALPAHFVDYSLARSIPPTRSRNHIQCQACLPCWPLSSSRCFTRFTARTQRVVVVVVVTAVAATQPAPSRSSTLTSRTLRGHSRGSSISTPGESACARCAPWSQSHAMVDVGEIAVLSLMQRQTVFTMFKLCDRLLTHSHPPNHPHPHPPTDTHPHMHDHMHAPLLNV